MAYFKKIDGLRGVAITLVLIEHFAHYLAEGISLGYFGVDLFFVISGFLITKILIKPNNLSFKTNYYKFLGRRTLRIFPLYYGTLIILWIVGLEEVKENTLSLFTYTYNYSSVIHGLLANPISHFWSLCVEEQFYLFWPIVVLIFKSRPKILLMVILTIIIFGYSQMTFNIFPNISNFNFIGLPTRMASLAMGALGAVLIQNFYFPQKTLSNIYVEYFILLGIIILLFSESRFKYFGLGICALYIVLKSATTDFSINGINRFLENDIIVRLGTISYGIYVLHMPIAHYFSVFIFDPIWLSLDFESFGKLNILQWHSWILKLPLYSITTYFVAKISFKNFEKPILNLKDKYFNYLETIED